jgi:hypothetical protein
MCCHLPLSDFTESIASRASRLMASMTQWTVALLAGVGGAGSVEVSLGPTASFAALSDAADSLVANGSCLDGASPGAAGMDADGGLGGMGAVGVGAAMAEPTPPVTTGATLPLTMGATPPVAAKAAPCLSLSDETGNAGRGPAESLGRCCWTSAVG